MLYLKSQADCTFLPMPPAIAVCLPENCAICAYRKACVLNSDITYVASYTTDAALLPLKPTKDSLRQTHSYAP